mmetsp:Transcript_100097/g.278891  ORF Transcript_100097/g.278891 Transcript_100097/m.278891 type:complete len:277 (-) Transcript_100097:2077-2907(-)
MVFLGHDLDIWPAAVAPSTASRSARHWLSVLGMASCAPREAHAVRAPCGEEKPAKVYRGVGEAAAGAALAGGAAGTVAEPPGSAGAGAGAAAKAGWTLRTPGTPSSQMTPKENRGSESSRWPSRTMHSQGSLVWSSTELGCPLPQLSLAAGVPSSHSQRPRTAFHEAPIQIVFFGQALDITCSRRAAATASESCCCCAAVFGMTRRLWAPHARRASVGPAKPTNSYGPYRLGEPCTGTKLNFIGAAGDCRGAVDDCIGGAVDDGTVCGTTSGLAVT